MRAITLVFVAVGAMALLAAPATLRAGETPGPVASPAASPTATASPIPSAGDTPGPLATPYRPVTVLPSEPPVVARAPAVGARLIVSAQPGGGEHIGTLRTRIDLVSQARGSWTLFTSDDGTFSFTDVPNGDYQLWIWWSPGFVNLVPAETNPRLAIIPFSVDATGTVIDPVPSILVRPNTEGGLTYPVPTGAGGNEIPVGTLSLANVGVDADQGSVQLPSVGSSSGNDNATNIVVGIGAIAALFALVGAGVVLRRRA